MAGEDKTEFEPNGPKNVNVLMFAQNDPMTDQLVKRLKTNQFVKNDITQTSHLDTVGAVMDDKNREPVDVVIKRHSGQFADNNADLSALVHEMRQRVEAGEAIPSLIVLGEKKPGFGKRVDSESDEIRQHFAPQYAQVEEDFQFDTDNGAEQRKADKIAAIKSKEDALIRLVPAAVQFSEIEDNKILEEITDLKEMGFFYAVDVDESNSGTIGEKERNILRKASEIKKTLQEKGKTRADLSKLRMRQWTEAKDTERTKTAEQVAVQQQMEYIDEKDEDTQPSRPLANFIKKLFS